MRVIGGRFGGRKLVGFDEDHIRPTSDRVKESLFNILRHEIDLQPDMDHEVVVLDLFSGTGNLAFEALSRGAKHVVCVEKSKRSIEIIKKNRSGLEVSNSQCQIVQKDVFVFLKAGTKNLEIEKPFDIILIDPPFTEKIAHKVMETLAQSPSLFDIHTVIAIESSRRERLDKEYLQLSLTDQREFGDKKLSFFKKRESHEKDSLSGEL